MTPEQFGRYLLQVRLAAGGMAELFQASLQGEAGFSKQVVVKRILPHLSHDQEFAAMFADEAILAARLHHPNIVQIYDFGQSGDSLYIAMEWVEGFDLYRIKKIQQPLQLLWPLSLVATIGAGVASGLAYVHQTHIVHRDISPHNIMVSPNGAIKITDFGIAKAMARLSKTKTGQLKGKISYMAPEQIAGEPASPWSDQFSLGIVLWEMATGRKLFQADSDAALLEQVRRCHIPSPSLFERAIPSELEQIILHMLAPTPTERYPDLDIVADLLSNVAGQLHSNTPNPPAEPNLGPYIQWIAGQQQYLAEHNSAPKLRQEPNTGIGTRKLAPPAAVSQEIAEEQSLTLPRDKAAMELQRKKTRRLSVRPTLAMRQTRYASRNNRARWLPTFLQSMLPWLLLGGFVLFSARQWLSNEPTTSTQSQATTNTTTTSQGEKPKAVVPAQSDKPEELTVAEVNTPPSNDEQNTGQVWLESPGQTLTVVHNQQTIGTTPLEGIHLPAGLIDLQVRHTNTSNSQHVWLLVPKQGKISASIHMW